MNILIIKIWSKRFIDSLPEIWYIILFALLTCSNFHSLSASWHIVNIFMILFSLTIVTLLIMQLFKKILWSRLLLGLLFTLGSIYMFLALLSEYMEFPTKTDTEAIQLIVAGSILIGVSFLLGGKMLLYGLFSDLKK
ncbi:hypothetical protein [Parabacteroides chinchillae]|uniref:Uncharacterized protein n=1 Tax=Parabacteroides chinchillae TaxID=871327 RepID=A0A8G2F0G8_9BACT|nr:hypothetical protein [Parabacteroides chinchillae]SEF51480.1 hypothetical protein SAMN05444001_10223 [Parabacteroides chinchillae]